MNPPDAGRSKRKVPLRQNNRVYNDGVLLWLMTAQRLRGGGTLEDGVFELLRGLADSFWLNPCKRLMNVAADGKPSLSCNTRSRHGFGHAPRVGPMCGDRAVSEQRLVDRSIKRLPEGAVIVGDANFGMFPVIRAAVQSKHPVVLRLSSKRTQSLLVID